MSLTEFYQTIEDSFVAGPLEFDYVKKRERKRLEKHLSTPISRVFLTRVAELSARYSRDVLLNKDLTIKPQFLTYIRTQVIAENERASNFMERADKIEQLWRSHVPRRPMELLQPNWYPTVFSIRSGDLEFVRHDIKTASIAYEKQREILLKWLSTALDGPELRAMRDKLSVPDTLSTQTLGYFRGYHTWSRIVDWYRSLLGDTDRKQFSLEGYEIKASRDGLIIKHPRLGLKVATFSQCQMIQDVFQMRANVYLSLDLGFHNGTSALRSLVDRLLLWQERVLHAVGNAGYELVKAPEALYKTHLTTLSGGDIDPVTSYSRMKQKLLEKEAKLASGSGLVDELCKIVEETGTIQDSVELFGLIKLSGHPCVDGKTSGRSVKEEALPEGTFTLQARQRMVRNIKHLILAGYIKKHQAWPPFCIPPAFSSKLGSLYRRRVTALTFNDYPLEELDRVKFGKFLEFDYSDDYLQFLDDKAICPGASKTHHFWYGGGSADSKRLLLDVLKREKFDTRALVDRISKGQTTREEEVVELTQKEREFKIAARCFAKMTFSMRTFFALTEYNLGETLMKDYFPQQSMTMSEAETKERLYKKGKIAADDNKRSAIIEIDFSRWNLRWRAEIVNAVAHVIEDIYGMPGTFSQAHEFFERSTIVLTEQDNAPPGSSRGSSVHNWPESDLVWRGHRGGFEGIQQKLWTICTIGMIHNAVAGMNCTFSLTGQGDNQVLLLHLPHGVDRLSTLIKFLVNLSTQSACLNHVVKPEECIDSSSVLTYSKEIYVHGVHMQYALKFAARLMNVADGDIPSLPAEISNACATTMIVANSIREPFRALFLQNFRVMRCLREERNMSLKPSYRRALSTLIDTNARFFSLLLPGSLGGLPIMSAGRYFMKGEVDELSWDLAAYIRLSEFLPSIRGDLARLIEGKLTMRTPDLAQLLKDPKSIPIRRPKDNRQLIKDAIRSRLPGYTKNEDILPLLAITVQKPNTDLITRLTSMRPFYPTIAKDIFESSIGGVQEKLFDRFTFTRTVYALLNDYHFLLEIQDSSESLVQFVLSRFSDGRNYKSGIYHPSQTYELATKLRSAWLPSADISHIAETTVCPFSLTLTKDIINTPCISATSRTPSSYLFSSTGPYPPNFGTKTRQKRTDHGVKIYTSGSTARDLKKLSLIASELDADGELYNVIDDVVRSRSPWTLEMIGTIFPVVIGGTAAHRHDSMQHAYFGVLGSNTVPTHLSFSTDRSGPLVGGKEDYPVVFQEYFLTLTNLAQITCDPSSSVPFCLGIAIPDLTPLPADKVNIKDDAPRITWPDISKNRLAYTSQLDIKLLTFRPPSRFVPELRRNRRTKEYNIDPASLIFSYLMSNTSVRNWIVEAGSYNTLKVNEFLDIAEYKGARPRDVIRAVCDVIMLESVYQASRHGAKEFKIRYFNASRSLAKTFCGPLLRLLSSDDRFSSEDISDCAPFFIPGEKGSRVAAQKLCDHLLMLVKEAVQAGCMLYTSFAYVFSDSPSSGLELLKRLSFLYAMRCGQIEYSEVGKLKKGLKARIDATVQTVTSDEDVSRKYMENVHFMKHYASERLEQDGQPILDSTGSSVRTKHGRIRTQKLKPALQAVLVDIKNNYPCMRYLALDSKEAIRLLRGRNPTLRHKAEFQKKVLIHPDSLISYASLNTSTMGEGAPEIPEPPTVFASESELVKGLLCRRIGKYSSALSSWLGIFTALKVSFSRSLLIGIGYGSAAAALHTLFGTTVVGCDLRTTIPAVPHRDVNWVPPEIGLSGDPGKFLLHPAIFATGGDIFYKGTRDYILKDIEGYDSIIYDIETGLKDRHLYELLLPYSGIHIVRCFFSLAQLKYELSYLVGTCRILQLTDLPLTSVQPWIVRLDNFHSLRESGNQNLIRLSPIKPLRYWIKTDTSDIKWRWDILLAPFQISLPELTKEALGKLITSDMPDGLPDLLQSKWQSVQDIIKAVVDTYDAVSADDILSYSRRVGLSPTTLRQLCLLSCDRITPYVE